MFGQGKCALSRIPKSDTVWIRVCPNGEHQMSHQRFVKAALVGLALLAVWPMFDASGQRRRSVKTTASLTINASIYYQLGGTQPVPPTAFYILDEDPEKLLSFLGEAPVATYAVA